LTKLAISAGVSLAAAGVALLIGFLPFAETIELETYDWRMRLTARPAGPSEDIVLVSIDDDSVRRMAPLVGRWPWPRLVHASLIDFLARAPAKLIVYDVLFTEPDVRRFDVGDEEWTGAQSDAALVDSVSRAGNVIVAADAAAEGLIEQDKALPIEMPGGGANYEDAATCVEDRPVLVPPFPALASAALRIGHTLLRRDPDGPVRRHVPFVRVGEHLVPALPVAGALATGDVREALQAQSARCPPPLLPFRGPTIGDDDRLSFTDYSFYDLFYSEQQILERQQPTIDPATFTDKIVVVSATASGTYELQVTPFAQGIGGGEVHANVIDSLLRGRSIVPLARGPAIALTIGAAASVGLLGGLLGVWPLAAGAAVVAAILTWIGVRWFAGGIWIPLVTPLVAVVLAFVGELAWQYFVEGREKRQVKRLFSRYVPRDVYNQLIADPTRAALGGKRRHMTVLFSDVRGFTAMSEKATPEDVVGQLNEYFSRMVQVLFAHHGTLDKFVGDMIMGLFGAPLDDEEHAEHAVQAALAMSRALDELNGNWAAAGKPQLDIGVGISTGDMVAGNIGSDTIMSYTVIGDTVNLGARLESLNKEYGTRVIISEATRAELKGRYDIRPLGDVTVKGKSTPVAIFEVRAI
jgi:adenylate cyclase